jgi:hypothetical protein
MIVFNRPGLTRQTFEAVRKQRPQKLFVIADGPRPNHPFDQQKCEEVRAIFSDIDWRCEVVRDYSTRNLGVEERVISGLNRVFDQVESAIVLEDDCLAHADFFSYCESLLTLYKHDERVALITGNNFQNGVKRGEDSYYFSKYPHTWGWATWGRVWNRYRGVIDYWPEWSKTPEWKALFPDLAERYFWNQIFSTRAEWDYSFTSSIWKYGGLTATPNVNLVSNLGFGEDSTHTSDSKSFLSDIPTSPLGELNIPSRIEQDFSADRYVFDQVFGGRGLRFPRVIFRYTKSVMKQIFKRLGLKNDD